MHTHLMLTCIWRAVCWALQCHIVNHSLILWFKEWCFAPQRTHTHFMLTCIWRAVCWAMQCHIVNHSLILLIIEWCFAPQRTHTSCWHAFEELCVGHCSALQWTTAWSCDLKSGALHHSAHTHFMLTCIWRAVCWALQCHIVNHSLILWIIEWCFDHSAHTHTLHAVMHLKSCVLGIAVPYSEPQLDIMI
jgi:hypothetical protein